MTRFYCWKRNGAFCFNWLAYQPESEYVVDCTDMSDDAFEAFVRSLGVA